LLKQTAILLAAALLLGGCGGKSEPSAAPRPPPPPSASGNEFETVEAAGNTSGISSDDISSGAVIENIKAPLSEGDYRRAYDYADSVPFVSFVQNNPGSQYVSGDGFDASVTEEGETILSFFAVENADGGGVFSGEEYFMWFTPADYNGSPEILLKCGRSEVNANKYTGRYEEYWYVTGAWELVMSNKGSMVNGGFEGDVSCYGVRDGDFTERYTDGYDGVYMNPEDRMPFAEGYEGIDAETLYLLASSESPPDASSEPISESTGDPASPAYTEISDFAIEGKWKSVGDHGFGQAQPGAIVVFDGVNCNFYSPQDTYAFYEDGGGYRLDVTSLLFAENLSFAVKLIDRDQIEIDYGWDVTSLKRLE
jgi:hypothetical protein